MFTFGVFGWVGLHERACYFLWRPVRVSAILSTAFFIEPLAWSTPLVLELRVSGHGACGFLNATFCFVDVLVGHQTSRVGWKMRSVRV
jgi:hypothetical protein